jgi:hypothetical protein
MLVVAPAWGERCVPLFTGAVLDSHRAALENFAGHVRYLCHTDRPEIVRAAITRKIGCDVACPSVPRAAGYEAFASATREALLSAEPGEVVVFLSADVIVSREVFIAVRAAVESGKKAVMCAGTRTLPDGNVPIGASSVALLAWSLENAHPLIRECFYGDGRTRLPSTIYFRDASGVSMRGFHLHPLAIVNDRALALTSTVDWDLATNYPREAVHVVTDPDELALAEISPAQKTFGVLAHPFTAADVARWASARTLPFHWWLFEHRITLFGAGAQDDRAFLDRLQIERRRAA